ncbi:MAG: cytochrome P450 [Deltaproteobacteria bacterium]|nr:cytochrome P450 [Deltaproteobacteria bacterium]MBW2724355.1 cytochrome P450 [Deltaproteobacteria bacterium]
MSQQQDELNYDPYDYDIDANPHPVWKRMRDEAPVYRNEKFDFYALSRFEDVMTASLDAKTFSSAYGTVLEMMSDEPGDSPMMIFLDAPKHTQLRKLVSRAFSPRRISYLEQSVRKVAASYLDPLVGSGGFDYLQDFGAKLPVMVISALLGVPEEDREEIRQWTDTLLHRDEGETDAKRAHDAVSAQLWGYFGRYVEERRSQPKDDMISDLIRAEIKLPDGSTRRLENVELLAFIGLLSGAGNETVARFLGWASTLLARHPEQRAMLAKDPTMIPAAVEEILRYEAPSPVQGRRTVREVELHGVVIPKGGKVLMLTGSAGRDEREYPDADRFDVTRVIDRHVSLGYGTHFCLGASLARMEARIALEETLTRFPEWDVNWDDTEWVHTSTVRGYHRVPISF